MIKETAQIICHRTELLPGRFTNSYEWDGPRSWPALVSRNMEREIPLMPWKLRAVPNSDWDYFAYDAKLFVREDSGAWLLWALPILVRRCWLWLMFRLVLTLMVWGLAYVEPGEIVSWKCVGRQRP